jgi:hypothetical protein
MPTRNDRNCIPQRPKRNRDRRATPVVPSIPSPIGNPDAISCVGLCSPKARPARTSARIRSCHS